MLSQSGFPTGDLRSQTPAFAINHPQPHSLAGPKVGKTRSAQNLDMNENIFGTTETVGKAKALAFIKPLDPRGLQRQRGDGGHVTAAQIFDRNAHFFLGRNDFKHIRGLRAARGCLNPYGNLRIVRNGTLPKIAQNIGVKKNIADSIIPENETEPLGGIKPLYAALYDATRL